LIEIWFYAYLYAPPFLPISAFQFRCRAWYGSLGLIPGTIWKTSCNNILLQLPVQSVPITTNLVSSNPAQTSCTRYNIMKILKRVAFVQLANIFALSLVSKIYQTTSICKMTLETVCKIYPRRWHLNGNMFVFACPIIAKSQCWLYTLGANTGQISVFALIYPYLPPNSTSGICAVVKANNQHWLRAIIGHAKPNIL
jgi:hypothetical protein